MNEKILFVDDDRNLLAACERILRSKFDLETAAGTEAGLAKINSSTVYAVVVADRQMPGMDGIQFLNKVREVSRDTVRIMLTGNADMDAVIRLVNENNIFRFLTKPCPTNLLIKALEDGLSLYRLGVAEKELLNKTLSGSIKLLTDILSMTDSPCGPSQNLRHAAATVSTRLGLENAWEIQLALMLAPIGNVTIPPETLVRSHSGQPLSEAETRMIEHLPETAAHLLANIPRLEGVAQIVRYQNKCFDGSGFPAGPAAGDSIPVGARLIKIIFDLTDLQHSRADQDGNFETMQQRKGVYDLALLKLVRQVVEGELTECGRSQLSMSVAAKDLAAGMVLRSNVETKDGTLILRAGNQLSGMTMEKIRNFESVCGLKEPIQVECPEALAAA